MLAGLSSLAGVGLGAAGPLLTKTAVDDARNGRTGAMPLIIAALVVLALIRFGASFLRRWAGGRLSLDVQHDLRQDVFGALSRLDGAGQDALRTGQVVSRATSDLQVVQGLLAMVPLAAGFVVLFVASLAVMVVLSPLLTVMALLVIPSVYLLTRATRTVLFPATWAAQQSAADVAEIVEEDVTGVRVVKGFGQEDRELGRLRTAAARLYRNRMRAVRLTGRISPGLAAMTSLGQVGVLALGGYLALHGAVTIGTFLAFSLYLAQLVSPTRMLSFLLILGQQARASVERVLEIVDARASVVDPADPQQLPDGPLAVGFDDVSFGYTSDEPVLDGFSLTVPAGATIALVGASGSGKSTVSLLLPRFYDPQAGRITVGGVDLREAGRPDLRARVGVVFEEAFLFSDTIAANIAYGRPGASAAEVQAAARAAEATEFIQALPDGIRHRDRRPRSHPVRRPAAAAGAGPGHDHRPPRAGARRCDQRGRPGDRGGHPRHPAPADRGPHDHPDRPPPVHPGPGRHGGHGRGRPGPGRRHPRRADEPVPALSGPARRRFRGSGRAGRRRARRGQRFGVRPARGAAWPP